MDKKAKQILFDTYWKNGVWIDARHTPGKDFKYAKQKGVMFDDISISHDECVKEIIKLTQKISVDTAVKAFMASLSTRRLELRSGLASYFLAKAIPPHKYKKVISGHSYDEDGNIAYSSIHARYAGIVDMAS
jgi:adenine-specific DNA methylase